MISEKELDGKEVVTKAYDPTPYETKLNLFVKGRVDELKSYRKSLRLEEEWKEADKEYLPTENLVGSGVRKHFETDQSTGLRSSLVRIGDSSDGWRSNIKDNALLVKIQTAMSIIIDRNPEAIMTALVKNYEKNTPLIQGLWKRSWEITKAKEVLKLFVFDLAKYGWAVGRTYPRKISFSKKVLTEVDTENAENNKFEDKEITIFNDLWRERLNPYRTWIDEMTRPYDIFSMNDSYYEIDYSYDAAEAEFSNLPNFKFISRTGNNKVVSEETNGTTKTEDQKERKDIVTIGFYENKLKDLYALYVPAKGICLHYCPLPNDDGILSVWHTMWVLRSSDSPYGLSLWQTIKSNKKLFDKMNNMTMDQLVLSIMKMGFYTGTDNLFGDGTFHIIPGKVQKVINGEVKWMDVPGPGADSWQGLKTLKDRMDDDSGINPTIQGEITGKTLGEILHAKEASLKRLKTPLENISDAIEQDAYLSLSWMSQIYSTPEIKEFASMNELKNYEKEIGQESSGVYGDQNQATGELQGSLKAEFMPSLSLHLDNKDNQLVESNKSRFFQVGKDIPTSAFRWRGIIRVVPKSILAPSSELEKQRKMEIFNFLAPILPGDPEILGKATKQILEINEEDPEDWLPDSWLIDPQDQQMFLDQNAQQAPMLEPTKLTINYADLDVTAQTKAKELLGLSDASPTGSQGPTGSPSAAPTDTSGGTPGMSGDSMQAQAGITPNKGISPIVPGFTDPGLQLPSINKNVSMTQ